MRPSIPCVSFPGRTAVCSAWRALRAVAVPCVLAATLAATLAGCGESTGSGSGSGPAATSSSGQPRTVRVATLVLQAREAEICRVFPATVRARRVVTLAAKGAGAVSAVYAEEGALLAPGSPILQVDDADLAERVAAASAARQRAAEERKAVAARRAYAAANLARVTRLAAEGGVSTDDLDRATAEHDALRRQDDALAAQERSLAHQERELAATRAYSRLTSPVRGVLARRMADAGAFVTAGQALAQVDDLSGPFDLVAAVDEALLPRVRAGQTVLVTVPALGAAAGGGSGVGSVGSGASSVGPATVSAVVASVDAATGTFTLKAQLPQDMTRAGARTGMFGRVLVPAGKGPRVLLPASAIVRRGDLDVVFVVDAGGVLRLRPVRLGPWWLPLERPDGQWLLPVEGNAPMTGDAHLAEVAAGVAPGDRVVANPAPDLAEGDRLAAGEG